MFRDKQKHKIPPLWFWLIAFVISITGLFLIGIKPEFLTNYWQYLAIYNLLLIFIGLFYLFRFLLLIKKQKKQHIVGVKFTLNLLKIIPILTILPIASFYAFSFSTVQENTKLATTGFSELNQKILDEINNVERDLNLFRVQEYLDLTYSILKGANTIILNSNNYKQDLINMLNSLVRNNRLCKSVIVIDGEVITSNTKKLCSDFRISEDIDLSYNVVDKNSEVLLVKLPLKMISNDNRNITIFNYFSRNIELKKVFDRIGIFKTGVNNAKINITSNILTKQFLLDFATTIVLTIIAMIIITAKMLENLMTPLNNLTIASRKISAGEYGTFATKSSKDDDMNILITEFNQMSKQVKQARMGLDTKNIYLETIIKYSSGIIAFDNKFNINLVNNQVFEILNIKQDNFIDKNYSELNINFLKNILDKFRTMNKFSEVVEFNHLILDITGSTLFNNNKKLGFILIIKDITDITKSQKLKAWSEVARRMAHEVKNPLNPIMLSAERLRNKFLIKDENNIIEKTTTTIINQVKSIDNIISSFANFEKPTQNYKKQNLNSIIKDVVNLYPNYSIKLNLADIPELNLDKDSIARMLINLIKNGIEANASQIEIRTKLLDKKVQLTITDDGKGFDKKIITKVFEPYTTNKKSGTGLGMAIIAKIIKEHNAEIVIDKDYTDGAKIVIVFNI